MIQCCRNSVLNLFNWVHHPASNKYYKTAMKLLMLFWRTSWRGWEPLYKANLKFFLVPHVYVKCVCEKTEAGKLIIAPGRISTIGPEESLGCSCQHKKNIFSSLVNNLDFSRDQQSLPVYSQYSPTLGDIH